MNVNVEGAKCHVTPGIHTGRHALPPCALRVRPRARRRGRIVTNAKSPSSLSAAHYVVAVVSEGAGSSMLIAVAPLAFPSRPPAWRALQDTHAGELTSKGRLRGSPPCLYGIEKVGQGHHARWLLGSYRGSLDFDVLLKLDRNPDEPCYKLQFHSPASARDDIGHMLLAAESGASSFRGMRISDDLRGRGHSQLLLAAWCHLCLTSNINATTRTINKPLLSLSLARLGFMPTNGRGQIVQITSATRLRDCRRAELPGASLRSAFVRTEFCAPPEPQLRSAVHDTLQHGEFRLAASPRALRNALTLRVN